MSEPCLALKAESPSLSGQADGIEDTPAAKLLADRHATWARQVPKDPLELWASSSVLTMIAAWRCSPLCARTVVAVRAAWEQAPRSGRPPMLSLRPLSRHDRVLDAHGGAILGAYRKRAFLRRPRRGVQRSRAADRGHEKQAMAETAEELLAGKGWLPILLRDAHADPAGGAGRERRPVLGRCRIVSAAGTVKSSWPSLSVNRIRPRAFRRGRNLLRDTRHNRSDRSRMTSGSCLPSEVGI